MHMYIECEAEYNSLLLPCRMCEGILVLTVCVPLPTVITLIVDVSQFLCCVLALLHQVLE